MKLCYCACQCGNLATNIPFEKSLESMNDLDAHPRSSILSSLVDQLVSVIVGRVTGCKLLRAASLREQPDVLSQFQSGWWDACHD